MLIVGACIYDMFLVIVVVVVVNTKHILDILKYIMFYFNFSIFIKFVVV